MSRVFIGKETDTLFEVHDIIKVQHRPYGVKCFIDEQGESYLNKHIDEILCKEIGTHCVVIISDIGETCVDTKYNVYGDEDIMGWVDILLEHTDLKEIPYDESKKESTL